MILKKNTGRDSLFIGHGKISEVLPPFPIDVVLESLMKRSIEGVRLLSLCRTF